MVQALRAIGICRIRISVAIAINVVHSLNSRTIMRLAAVRRFRREGGNDRCEQNHDGE